MRGSTAQFQVQLQVAAGGRAEREDRERREAGESNLCVCTQGEEGVR